jgi:hypothetical protein
VRWHLLSKASAPLADQISKTFNNMQTDDPLLADQAVEALRNAVTGGEVSAEQIRAANILLQRFAPKKNDEEQRNETAERDAAFTEAYGLLTQLARYKYAFNRIQNALVEASKVPTDHTSGELAHLANHGWAWLGEDKDGG